MNGKLMASGNTFLAFTNIFKGSLIASYSFLCRETACLMAWKMCAIGPTNYNCFMDVKIMSLCGFGERMKHGVGFIEEKTFMLWILSCVSLLFFIFDGYVRTCNS